MTSENIYRALIFLHPKSFREDYGEEMLQLFRDLRRHQRRPNLVIWARVIGDLFVSVIYERKEWLMSKKTGYALGFGASITAIIYTLILMGVGGSIRNALVVFGVVLGIVSALVGISALIGGRMKAPTEMATVRRNWWVPAPCLLAIGYAIMSLRPLTDGVTMKDLTSMLPVATFGGLMVFGLLMRYRRPGNLGNFAIVLASLPALPFLWFPPIPVVGLVSIVGALSDAFASRRSPDPTPAS